MIRSKFMGTIAGGIGFLFVLSCCQKRKGKKPCIVKIGKTIAEKQNTACNGGYFVGVRGILTGMHYPIKTGTWMTLGSDPSRCSLLIGGKETSSVHMQIYFDGSQFHVVDYSDAGTYVFRRGYLPREQTIRVRPGTCFRIGNSGDRFMLKQT